MSGSLEILRIGPNGTLFQIRDGLVFGQLVVGDGDLAPSTVAKRLRHAAVAGYLERWLSQEGVLVGTPRPPRLEWIDIAIAVPMVRDGSARS